MPSKSSFLKTFYANVRSIRTPGKLEELQCILKAIPSTVHIVILTETWITSEQDAKLYDLPNYKHIYNYRHDSKGGGVSIYIHEGIPFEVTEDTYKDSNHYLWIYLPKYALHIGGIYKPGHSNIKEFLERYTLQLEARKRSIVFGDFNLDLLNPNTCVTQYLSELEENGYDILNKIDKEYSTRQTQTTNTILDHVTTDLQKQSFHFVILESAMSDHKQIYLEMFKYKPKIKQKIQYEAIDYENLYKSISKATCIGIDDDYKCLEAFVTSHILQNKKQKSKIMNLPKDDWINKEVIKMIDNRNTLWQQLKNEEANIILKRKFLAERNKVSKKINNDKNSYYYYKLQKCNNNPKKMWKTINYLAINKTKTNILPPKLIVNSQSVTEGEKICDILNIYFASIGTELADRIPLAYHLNSGNTLMYKDGHVHTETLTQFRHCTIDEVTKLIDNLDADTSTGVDGISTKALKCIKNIIISPLVSCVNKCLDHGTFPDSLKLAKVSPIFKSGAKTDPSNYRPISVLPVISKIFEKIIYNRLIEYLNEKSFLIDQQYGFRSKSNTLSATIDLVTNIKTNIDKTNIGLGIFIDLKKAFDTVSHAKLLQKLINLGITGTAYKLFESYLSNRYQIVKIGNYKSVPRKITCGVPQGSILGPPLFLIYVNNINQIGLKGYLTLYADDTSIFYFGQSIHDIISEAQNDLNVINEWFLHNLLTINTSKTSYMIFAAKNKKIPPHAPLIINNLNIKQSNTEKYLGLLLDDKLSWKPHIEHVRAKLVSLSGALRKIGNCLPSKIKHTIYNSLVKSNLEYLIEIWGSASKTNLNYIQRTQNKIIKRLYCYDFLTPTKQLYEKTKLFNLRQLYNYNTCILVKKFLDNTTQTNIKLTQKIYTYNLRNRNEVVLRFPRTVKYGKKNFLYEGVQLYNKLPNEIKECKSINIYKRKLKDYIMQKVIST